MTDSSAGNMRRAPVVKVDVGKFALIHIGGDDGPNQVARDYKENNDANIAASEPLPPGVEENYRRDGNCTQPVDFPAISQHQPRPPNRDVIRAIEKGPQHAWRRRSPSACHPKTEATANALRGRNARTVLISLPRERGRRLPSVRRQYCNLYIHTYRNAFFAAHIPLNTLFDHRNPERFDGMSTFCFAPRLRDSVQYAPRPQPPFSVSLEGSRSP